MEKRVNTNQATVLVVDDDASIRDMIRFVLEKAEMDVQTAANAHEGLLRINEKRPDIILLDWMMPGLSGLEMTRRLRKEPFTQDIPIIMLTVVDQETGIDFKSSAPDPVWLPVDAYMDKPARPDVLLSEVKKLLSSKMEK